MKKNISEEYLKRIRENPKPSIPKEHSSNSMTTVKKPLKMLYRPHNYRRQLRVGLKTNSTIKKILDTIPKATIGEHNKLISIIDYKPHITLQYGSDTLTAIYKQNIIGGHKETYLIRADNITQFNKRVDHHKNIAKKRSDKVLKDFARQFKIFLPFEKIKWGRGENWIRGEEFIDSIPAETIIHDNIFKKVYPEGIEFTTGKGEDPTGTIKNFIKNRAIEDISPKIAESIDNIVQTFENNALLPFTEQSKALQEDIRLHLEVEKRKLEQTKMQIEVQRETLKTLKAIQREKRSLSKEWGW